MNVSLEVSHLANEVLDDLRRQFFKHLLFGAPEDERSDALFEALDRINEELGLF